jgi:hypothetical protein
MNTHSAIDDNETDIVKAINAFLAIIEILIETDIVNAIKAFLAPIIEFLNEDLFSPIMFKDKYKEWVKSLDNYADIVKFIENVNNPSPVTYLHKVIQYLINFDHRKIETELKKMLEDDPEIKYSQNHLRYEIRRYFNNLSYFFDNYYTYNYKNFILSRLICTCEQPLCMSFELLIKGIIIVHPIADLTKPLVTNLDKLAKIIRAVVKEDKVMNCYSIINNQHGGQEFNLTDTAKELDKYINMDKLYYFCVFLL